MGGKWNKEYKLWYISHNKYEKHKDELYMHAIWWVCKDCEDMEKMEKKVVVMLVGKRTLVGLMTIKDY